MIKSKVTLSNRHSDFIRYDGWLRYVWVVNDMTQLIKIGKVRSVLLIKIGKVRSVLLIKIGKVRSVLLIKIGKVRSVLLWVEL